jgi:hypothetical protein
MSGLKTIDKFGHVIIPLKGEKGEPLGQILASQYHGVSEIHYKGRTCDYRREGQELLEKLGLREDTCEAVKELMDCVRKYKERIRKAAIAWGTAYQRRQAPKRDDKVHEIRIVIEHKKEE